MRRSYFWVPTDRGTRFRNLLCSRSNDNDQISISAENGSGSKSVSNKAIVVLRNYWYFLLLNHNHLFLDRFMTYGEKWVIYDYRRQMIPWLGGDEALPYFQSRNSAKS